MLATGLGLGLSESAGGPQRPDTWFVPGSPQLRVEVRTGCPHSITRYQDVVSTYTGPALVPPKPLRGMICSYAPARGRKWNQLLVGMSRLGGAAAGTLAAAVRQLQLDGPPPAPIAACPMEGGTVAVIGFSYRSGLNVGLWFETSGCPTIDNGWNGAWYEGNPSFYKTFMAVFDRLPSPAGQL